MGFRSSLLHFLVNRKHLGARDRTLIRMQANPQAHFERVVGQAEVIRFDPSRGPLAAILPLFPRRYQPPIPLGLNLALIKWPIFGIERGLKALNGTLAR